MLVFPVTYLLFPFCVWLFLLAMDRRNEYSLLEFLLYSFGMVPALVALILYYALLLFPGCNGTLYVLAVCAVFGLMGIIGIRAARRRFSNGIVRNRRICSRPIGVAKGGMGGDSGLSWRFC